MHFVFYMNITTTNPPFSHQHYFDKQIHKEFKIDSKGFVWTKALLLIDGSVKLMCVLCDVLQICKLFAMIRNHLEVVS